MGRGVAHVVLVVATTKPSASHASRRWDRRPLPVSPTERGSPTKHTATAAISFCGSPVKLAAPGAMVELAGRWPLTAERNARPDVNVMDAGAPVAELASSTLTISRRRAIASAIASRIGSRGTSAGAVSMV